MKRRLLITISITLAIFLVGILALVWSGTTDYVGHADVALVLGNKVNPDGSPSARLKARLDTAAQFFKKGNFPLIIVSGGTGKEGVAEGTAMKRYLLDNGIPEDAIIVDDQGIDTAASARNTARILHDRSLKSAFVITQYFHVPRSVLALKKCGVSPVFHAHPHYFEPRDLYSIIRELPAYIKYLVFPPVN